MEGVKIEKKSVWRSSLRRIGLTSMVLVLMMSCSYSKAKEGSSVIEKPQPEEVLPAIQVGAERTNLYLSQLEGKSVGVVGNQSSLIFETHLVDSLISSGIQVKKVFSPEHGFRGDADAGEHVKNNIDPKTGLPIVSLYGKNKKPTAAQLKGLDVVVFDIQDVGVRFYTYISTLHYVMEACAEQNIPVIVLDRPNPNAHYVDGPVLDMRYKSFVGMHPVPIVYGMTIGEYGHMINGEHWLAGNLECDYQVIPCQFYDRTMPYSLPVAPSPNLRSDLSIQLYPSLCLLEATTVTVGRGTDGPFERYGHPDFPETGYAFTPQPGEGSKNPKHKGKRCNGFNLDSTKYERIHELDLSFVLNANELLNGKLFVDREKFFNLLAGNNVLIKQLKERKTQDEIRESWSEELSAFKTKRKKYLLYP